MAETNAQKIASWRAAHPGETITAATLRDVLGVSTLRDANLWAANLRDADLRDANLRGADLWGANLWAANLRDANLRGADLRNANLWGADLWGADLWGGLPIQADASGSGYLIPTPDGWRITIGCWRNHTLADLADLIADRVEWPEATGDERDRRRPMLTAVLALCEAHIGQQPADIIDRLAEKWSEHRG